MPIIIQVLEALSPYTHVFVFQNTESNLTVASDILSPGVNMLGINRISSVVVMHLPRSSVAYLNLHFLTWK